MRRCSLREARRRVWSPNVSREYILTPILMSVGSVEGDMNDAEQFVTTVEVREDGSVRVLAEADADAVDFTERIRLRVTADGRAVVDRAPRETELDDKLATVGGADPSAAAARCGRWGDKL